MDEVGQLPLEIAGSLLVLEAASREVVFENILKDLLILHLLQSP